MLERLDAAGIRRWADLGLEGLARHRGEIDALNVFPVPDGDTGTNLFLTFDAARTALCGLEAAADLPATVATFAQGALLGARGNSGIILSQLVRGFADTVSSVDLSADVLAQHEVLAQAFRRAAQSAYDAVAEPREGTVLTVARAAADAVGRLGPGTSLAAVVTAAADAAAEALARTPEQLDVLARAGVVDAGGRGLVVVLEALVETVTGVRRDPGPTAPAIPIDAHGEPDAGGGRYEVMYLLDADEAAVHALRTALVALGDSVVVVGGPALWNVHAHVDDVGAAIEAGIEAGRPHRVRVTDLREQVETLRGLARGRSVVAVAHGPGTAALLEASGAAVVRARANVAPSTAEMLDAVHRAGTREIVLLPSDSDSRPVAEAAAEEARAEGLRASVVPTRSIVQTLAAVAVHDPDTRFDDDVVAMTRAASATRYGGVSVASREAITSAGVCRVGDVLGIVEGDVVEIGETVEDVAVRILTRILHAGGGELVTLVLGEDCPADVAATVERRMRRDHHGVEVVAYSGGQPLWPLIVGVE
ncbi:MAG: DAK2 domain-containing protein [Frankiales bacterium]|nr:DAK2 domain-containing protein [Frankiales bacterium]